MTKEMPKRSVHRLGAILIRDSLVIFAVASATLAAAASYASLSEVASLRMEMPQHEQQADTAISLLSDAIGDGEDVATQIPKDALLPDDQTHDALSKALEQARHELDVHDGETTLAKSGNEPYATPAELHAKMDSLDSTSSSMASRAGEIQRAMQDVRDAKQDKLMSDAKNALSTAIDAGQKVLDGSQGELDDETQATQLGDRLSDARSVLVTGSATIDDYNMATNALMSATDGCSASHDRYVSARQEEDRQAQEAIAAQQEADRQAEEARKQAEAAAARAEAARQAAERRKQAQAAAAEKAKADAARKAQEEAAAKAKAEADAKAAAEAAEKAELDRLLPAGDTWYVEYRNSDNPASANDDGSLAKWKTNYYIAHDWSDNGKRIALKPRYVVVDGKRYRYVSCRYVSRDTKWSSIKDWAMANNAVCFQVCDNATNTYLITRYVPVR